METKNKKETAFLIENIFKMKYRNFSKSSMALNSLDLKMPWLWGDGYK